MSRTTGTDGVPRFRRVTPPGRGALAAVAVRGVGRLVAPERWFSPAPATDRPVHGRILAADGETIDDAVWIPCGPDTALITVHGNPQFVDALAERLRALGLEEEPAVPGAGSLWEDGATEGRGAPALRREALEVATSAPTLDGVLLLLEQAELLDDWSTAGASVPDAELRAAIDRAPSLLAFEEPPRVVLAGVPNAGKSTLFNRLLGRERVVVHPTPGTTRDRIEELGVVGERPVTWIDGAGLRDADDTIEAEGVRRMRSALADAALVVLLEPPDAHRPEEVDPTGPRVLRIRSRADQILSAESGGAPHLRVSGTTGVGIEDLLRAVEERLFGPRRRPEGPTPFTGRQVDALEAVLVARREGADEHAAWERFRGGGTT